jgi:hypothetical protein
MSAGFYFFVFDIYYQAIFAIRIFIVHAIGLIAANIVLQFIIKTPNSIITRTMGSVFLYFMLYYFMNLLIAYEKYGKFYYRGRTAFAESATFALTLFFSLFFSIAVYVFQYLRKKRMQRNAL